MTSAGTVDRISDACNKVGVRLEYLDALHEDVRQLGANLPWSTGLVARWEALIARKTKKTAKMGKA